MAQHRNPLPTAEEKAQRKHERRMEKVKKTGLVLAAVLVVIAAFFTYSHFFGNPFSKISAESDIKAYIEENFSSLDLELSAVKYDRDSGRFYAVATSADSEDTHFYVYSANGETNDYYEDSVKNLYNTIERFENAFAVTAKKVLTEQGIADEKSEITVSVADFIKARDSGEFSLDMAVTSELETDFSVYVTLEKTASVKSLAETVTAVKDALAEADLPDIVFFNITLTDGEKTAKAYNVAVSDVTAKLESILQYALDNPFDAFSDVENTNPLTVSIQ